MNNQITITLLDDHEIMRDGLSTMLKTHSNFKVMMSESNGLDLIKKLEHLPPKDLPDIILLDINIPGIDGIETAKIIRFNFPFVKMVVLSMSSKDTDLIASVRAGVNGYVSKNASMAEFVKTLEEVMEKGSSFSEEQKSRISAAMKHQDAYDAKKTATNRIAESLSVEEKAFLKYSMTDLTYAEIAKKLNTSTTAIESIRQGLFSKLNVKSRVGLALFAQKMAE